jgi:hypothetical protein
MEVIWRGKQEWLGLDNGRDMEREAGMARVGQWKRYGGEAGMARVGQWKRYGEGSRNG